MNSGAKIFLFILIGCVAVLTITLILIGVLSKGKKIKGGLKFLVVLLSLMTTSSFITFPLAYHNYIDVNVRFGYFKSVNERDEIKITRSSCEYYYYSGDHESGNWTLKNDELTLYLPSGNQVYKVKDMGTDLYKDGELAFRYMVDKRL